MIINWSGPLGFEHGTSINGVVCTNNVFYNASQFDLFSPNYVFENNTFVFVAMGGSPLSQDSNHPIRWRSAAANLKIKNNLFVGCGKQSISPETHGWYEIPAGSIYEADYNMVTGISPDFKSKVGFGELNGINGGNPLFKDIYNPLGNDGLPFTADDGLQLIAGSPAIGRGALGLNIGAYQTTSILRPRAPTSLRIKIR